MHADRMLKLADLLETDANNPTGAKFNIAAWGSSTTETMELSCGTSACAMGIAALSGAFAADGLKYEIGTGGCKCEECLARGMNKYRLDVYCDGREGFGAAEQLFGISQRTAWRLFSPDYYGADEQTGKVGELAVANRIREHVANEQGAAMEIAV